MKGKDKAWCALCCTLLFLSSSPTDDTPYAFVYLKKIVLKQVDPATFTIVLGGRSEADEKEGDSGDGNNENAGPPTRRPVVVDENSYVEVVFLFPDGRWQVFDMPQLELQLRDLKQMERWVVGLKEICGEPKPAPVPDTKAQA